MTAVELGNSTINITKDTTAIATGIDSFMESYNSLVDLIATESLNADSNMYDMSSIKSIVDGVKENLFSNYGVNNDQNMFNYGMAIDTSGHLSMDSSIFADALVDNYANIKNMFLGNTTDTDLATSDSTKYMGLGTIVKSFLDNLDSSSGIITIYETSMASRREALEQEREKAIESLDTKYSAMASQFSAYGSAITQMESSFAGLGLMIEQSVSSN